MRFLIVESSATTFSSFTCAHGWKKKTYISNHGTYSGDSETNTVSPSSTCSSCQSTNPTAETYAENARFKYAVAISFRKSQRVSA